MAMRMVMMKTIMQEATNKILIEARKVKREKMGIEYHLLIQLKQKSYKNNNNKKK